MSFLGPSRDASLAEQIAALPKSRWVIAGLSLLVTVIIATGFLLESRWGYSGRVVKVVFFQSWNADRSLADVHSDREAEIAAMRVKTTESQRYIATLPPAQQKAARAQYDAYVKALPADLKP